MPNLHTLGISLLIHTSVADPFRLRESGKILKQISGGHSGAGDNCREETFSVISMVPAPSSETIPGAGSSPFGLREKTVRCPACEFSSHACHRNCVIFGEKFLWLTACTAFDERRLRRILRPNINVMICTTLHNKSTGQVLTILQMVVSMQVGMNS